MTRRRVDNYPMNHVDDGETQDSVAMMRPSNSDQESVNSSFASKPKKPPLDEEEDDDERENEKVKDLLVYYARNSTMHGIPSIVGSKLYRGRHVFWMGIVGMMALFLGFVIYSQMKDYYDYPTVTSVDVHYVTKEDFPSITICDPNVFNAKIIQNVIQYGKLSNYTLFQLARIHEIEGLFHVYAQRMLAKEKDPPQKGQTDTVREVSRLLKFSEIIMSSPKRNPVYCSWGEYYWTACPATRTRITDMGVCMTFDVRKLMNMTHLANTTSHDDDKKASPVIGNFMRGLTFYLDSGQSPSPYRIFKNVGFKIVLHDHDQEPLPMAGGINIRGNAAVEIEVAKNVKEGLPPPYKAFGTATCVDADPEHFVNPLQRFSNYTKQVCEQECFINIVIDQCGGCRHYLHPGEEEICDLDHLAVCYREAQKLYYGGEGQKQCDCPLPCRQVNFKGSVTAMDFVETAYMKELRTRAGQVDEKTIVSYVHIFYADPVVTTMRQVAIYSTEGLLGSIGGQIGLFMGFSLVTVAEMLELLFLLATRGRKLDEQVKRHKDAQEAAQSAVQAA